MFHCDGDRILPPDYVSRFLQVQEARPDAVIAASTPPLRQFGLDWQTPHGPPFAAWRQARRTWRYRMRRGYDLLSGCAARRGYRKPWRTPFYTAGVEDTPRGSPAFSPTWIFSTQRVSTSCRRHG